VVSDAAAELGHDPAVSLDGPVDTAVSDEVGDLLLDSLRGLLSTVARHTGATGTTSVAVHVDGTVALRVTGDDTAAGDPVGADELRHMRQQAEALGGTMTMIGAPAGGTAFEWQVPSGR
jgi:signal transduction histidine kinase